MSDKRKHKKDSCTEKKSKAWNRGKRIQIPVTITEGLAATDKGQGRWLFLQGSSVTDVWEDSTCNSVSTTGVTQENLELPLLPNFYSHQTQNNMIKSWTDFTFPFPSRRGTHPLGRLG